MKRILLIAAALVSALTVQAQNSEEILSKIAKAPARKAEVVSRIKEVRTPADPGAKPTTLKGSLLFKPEDYLTINYDNKDQFIINGTRMVSITGGVNQVFDTSKNLMMKNLSDVLICSFMGRLSDLATAQNSDIKAEKSGKDFVVTLTARKKSARGLNKLTVTYSAADCSIKGMTMYEVTGATTTYSIE